MHKNLLKYQFKNKSLFLQAVTHHSWVNEKKNGDLDNQRLEFLGDTVLKLIQSQKLYDHNPVSDEGILTQIRNSQENNQNLSIWANQLGINQLIRCGKGINENYAGWGGICAGAFEALLGAIWIDCGKDFEFIENLYHSWDLEVNYNQSIDNPKKELQEFLHKNKCHLPQYSFVNKQGPDHCPIYTISCTIKGLNNYSVGKGKSIKEAEKIAAKLMVEQLVN